MSVGRYNPEKDELLRAKQLALLERKRNAHLRTEPNKVRAQNSRSITLRSKNLKVTLPKIGK
jgi:hypothetical protein